MAISSWPNKGGNETIISKAMGISQDPGYSATFFAYGARKFTIYNEHQGIGGRFGENLVM